MRIMTACWLLLVLACRASGAEGPDCGPVPPGGQFDGQCHLSAAPPPSAYRSMKGFELFSWREMGKWYFSLVPGKNSDQPLFDVREAKLEGTAELKKRLSGIGSGERLSWNTRPVAGLYLRKPPKKLMQEVRDACKRSDIRLSE